MTAGPCPRFAKARSEYVDGSIEPDAERTLSDHLGGCFWCRADVTELRRVRTLLSSRAADGPPSGLEERLAAIAGVAQRQPLWTRPFRRVRSAHPRLPSRRRRIRRQAGVAATAAGSLLVAGAGAGYLVAPPRPTAIGDPTTAARTEFTAALQLRPLTSSPASAVTVLGDQLGDQLRTATAPAAPPVQASRSWSRSASGYTSRRSVDPSDSAAPVAGRSITGEVAGRWLRRAQSTSERTGYVGNQDVVVRTKDRIVRATVWVQFVPGQGSDLSITDRDGAEVERASLPLPTTPTSASGTEPASAVAGNRTELTDLAALVGSRYQLAGVTDAQWLGRSVTVVEARWRDGAISAPAARWWIDQSSGVLVGRQTFDRTGEVVQSAMATSLSVSPERTDLVEHPAGRLSVPTATTSMGSSPGSSLSRAGWCTPGTLAGLPLTRVSADRAGDPSLLQLVYSDGVSTVSVLERRGRVSTLPAGTELDQLTGAYLTPGTPRTATWQSGDRVLTVVTDGPDSQLTAAVRELPHVPAPSATTMGRIHAGWSRIIESIFG